MCRVTVLIEDGVFAPTVGSRSADSGGSFSITLCVVGAPDSAGAHPAPRLSWLFQDFQERGNFSLEETLPCDAVQPAKGPRSYITRTTSRVRLLNETLAVEVSGPTYISWHWLPKVIVTDGLCNFLWNS